MHSDHSTLILIPARKGSKGIPNKNLAILGGKPLVSHTINTALQAKLPARICLSTDSLTIRDLGLTLGVEAPFLRPDELALDESPMLPTINHALTWYEVNESFHPNVVVLLQPTSPFLSVESLTNAYQNFVKQDKDCLISVNLVKEHPSEYITTASAGFNYVMDPPSNPGRQFSRKVFFINGAIYITKTTFIKKTNKIYDRNALIFEMPQSESLDINDPDDLDYANYLYHKRF